jgi:pyridoxamine 5'-phosphate oxidase
VTPDELSAVLNSTWDILSKGASSRKSPVHAPVVATIDDQGFPTQRVMILREVASDTRMLRFHTDARSPKIEEIAREQHLSVLAYHPEEAIQLRMQGIAKTEIIGDAAEAAWQASTLFARRCYMSELAPGTPCAEPASGLPSWIAGKMPSDEQIEPARENFAIIKVEIKMVDWLHLANSGHKRAWLTYADTGWCGEWIIP